MTAKKKPVKPCNCLKELVKKLEPIYGPVELQTKMALNFKTGIMRSVVPPLYFTYAAKTASGAPHKTRRTKGFVAFSYCPYCGRKGTG